jgi:hypothetical protein
VEPLDDRLLLSTPELLGTAVLRIEERLDEILLMNKIAPELFEVVTERVWAMVVDDAMVA